MYIQYTILMTNASALLKCRLRSTRNDSYSPQAFLSEVGRPHAFRVILGHNVRRHVVVMDRPSHWLASWRGSSLRERDRKSVV